MDIGCALHDARERQGLSLEQVSDATKISVTILNRIERNEFDRLPGSVFTKGYLRAYAEVVGISSEPLVKEYVRQTEPVPVVEPRNGAKPPPKPAPWDAAWRIRVPHAVVRNLRTSWPIAVTTIAVVALIVVLYEAVTTRAPENAALAAATAAGERAETDAAPASAADGAATAGTAGQHRPFPATLEMSFTKPCWVSLKADGASVVYRLVQPGETVTAQADNEMIVRVGDPTAFTYTVNGAAGRPVGKPGAPVTFRINPQTYPDLIDGRGAAVN